MRTLALLVFGVMLSPVFGQSGKVTEERIVTVRAEAPATSPVLTCTLSNATPPVITAVCSVAGVIRVTVSSAIAVGVNGFVGSYSEGGNTITWIIKQPTADTFIYDVAANGSSKTGTF